MLDLTRSSFVFDPKQYRGEIHIIGVGATGSYIAKNLILNGVRGKQIHVYDYDHVEGHNVGNQVYTSSDVGTAKVKALYNIILRDYSEKIRVHNMKVEDASGMRGVIFFCIDGKRGPLFETMVNQPGIDMVIETGLVTHAGVCVTINPITPDHVRYFRDKRISDGADSSIKSACGSRQVIVTTVQTLASRATEEFMQWVMDPTHIGRYCFFSTRPFYAEEEEI